MIKIDISLGIQIVNFLFLIWVLNLILYRPIRDILIKRNEKINGLEQGIDAFKRDTKEKEEAFADGIKEARAKGLKEKEDLITAASDEEKKIIEGINEEAQANLAKIREEIAKDTEAVRASLEQEVDEFAKSIGQKILGRAV